MRAALYDIFDGPIYVTDVPTPDPRPTEAIVRVKANGICRSDWHAWQGHDPSIHLPHVPGHECCGIVEAVGRDVHRIRIGDRVVVPFSGGCGSCEYCRMGLHNICDADYQPGFSDWGAFAEFVRVGYADENLVLLPEEIGFVEAAGIGCRFMTAFGAVADRGSVKAGDRVAVFGCGGVGLSAILIAAALGAQVTAIDVRPEAIRRAELAGAYDSILLEPGGSAAPELRERTHGGVHVSIDAFGSPSVVHDSVASLRKRGTHVQVGLLNPDEVDARLPIDMIVGRELHVIGSHGFPAPRFGEILDLVVSGTLSPGSLVTDTVSLARGASILMEFDTRPTDGVVVIDSFGA